MFPLGTVLLPGIAMSLHVFEPRYQALTRSCLDGDGHLGIVLIERGNEVGGGDVRFAVGTRARIAEAVALDDGHWLLVLVGVDRIRVDRWLPELPFPRAVVEVLADEAPGPGAGPLRDQVEGLLRRAMVLKAELGELDGLDIPLRGPLGPDIPLRGPLGPDIPLRGPLGPDIPLRGPLGPGGAPSMLSLAPEADLAAWQATAVAPFGPADAQRVLEADGTEGRLSLLAELLSDEVDVLAHRVAGR